MYHTDDDEGKFTIGIDKFKYPICCSKSFNITDRDNEFKRWLLKFRQCVKAD